MSNLFRFKGRIDSIRQKPVYLEDGGKNADLIGFEVVSTSLTIATITTRLQW
jgi:hypothetical protein